MKGTGLDIYRQFKLIRGGYVMGKVDQVISSIKLNVIESSQKKYRMKYRVFLNRMGRQKNSQKAIDKVNEQMLKHGIEILRDTDDPNWYEESLDTTFTFILSKQQEENFPLLVGNENAGIIIINKGQNPVELYMHQKKALLAMDQKINKKKHTGFAGLLVIPTGGGKTLTAVQWLLKNAINKNKKVLWIAHRHELLEQALSAVVKNSYANLIPDREQFTYRIISGRHDRAVHINSKDDFIIASKDSLNHGMNYLKENWLEHHEEIYLVIDEAHHAPAKTYRKIINAAKETTQKLNIIGLTATPSRTAESEKGLLKQVFSDDIIYKIDLQKLIAQGILSKPVFSELTTNLHVGKELSEEDVQAIQAFDSIPESVAKYIVENKVRNNRIVQEYVDKKEEYGKLLVFAVNRVHAIQLNKLFRLKGIRSEYIISGEQTEGTNIQISAEENGGKIKKFRNNEIDVLVNVNILTEGTDLPDVQTVFLTRPTTSTILMTQMIGRALRGERAGGTEKANIVSFIDDWESKIAWVHPEKLYIDQSEFPAGVNASAAQLSRLISIKKIEEFARLADESLFLSDLQKIEFLKTVPLGIYSFSYLKPTGEGEEQTINCEVLIYDSTQEAYEQFIEEMKECIDEANLSSADIFDEEILEELVSSAEEVFFIGRNMIPSYRRKDIEDIIKYIGLTGELPMFLPFHEREKLDVSTIANHIYENDLGVKAKSTYIDGLWEDKNNFLAVYFGYNKLYFYNSIENELRKILNPEMEGTTSEGGKVCIEKVSIERKTLQEIKQIFPEYWRDLTGKVYAKSIDQDGNYVCAETGFKSKNKLFFHIDHIVPMADGGLSEEENLQVLERYTNIIKRDKVIENL